MARLRIDVLMLLVLALALALVTGTVFAQAREIRGFAMTVSNLDQAVAFYEQALGFRKVEERTVSDRAHDELTGVFGTRVRPEGKPETKKIIADRVVTTTCPYCGVGCNLQQHVKADFIYKVTSPFDSPVNQGNLCVKGRFGYDFIYHPKRVTTPLVRRYLLEGRPKPEGREQVFAVSTNGSPISNSQISNDWDWVETDWDTALNLTADRLVEIYKRDGSDAMAVYCCAKATNEDNYLLQKIFRALFRTNNVDHCTRLCHAGSVVALQKAQDKASGAARNVMHFFRHESYGQCTPCRAGTAKAADPMRAPRWDAGLLEELSGAMADASICGLGQAAPNPVRSVIKFFRHEIE